MPEAPGGSAGIQLVRRWELGSVLSDLGENAAADYRRSTAQRL